MTESPATTLAGGLQQRWSRLVTSGTGLNIIGMRRAGINTIGNISNITLTRSTISSIVTARAMRISLVRTLGTEVGTTTHRKMVTGTTRAIDGYLVSFRRNI